MLHLFILGIVTLAHYFFPPTRIATAQITDLFDFVWPTAAALWNLRWQVNGFLLEVPTSTPKQLHDRFVFGSTIHGTNLKKACVQTSWEEQKHHMSGIVLTNAFAIYEHWADEILACVGLVGGKGKRLQFDDTPTKAGLPETLQDLCTNESATIKKALYPTYVASPKYSLPIIKNLLVCYRFFKELRNAQIHNGSKATKEAEAAYLSFVPVSSKVALGMKGNLVHDAVVEGHDIRLHLRGVVGFCDVLFRMIVTVDAELSRSEKAEAVLEKALRQVRSRTLSSNPQRRHLQLLNHCRSAKLPNPADMEAMRQFMLAKRIITV
jgi:hypothetical protein